MNPPLKNTWSGGPGGQKMYPYKKPPGGKIILTHEPILKKPKTRATRGPTTLEGGSLEGGSPRSASNPSDGSGCSPSQIRATRAKTRVARRVGASLPHLNSGCSPSGGEPPPPKLGLLAPWASEFFFYKFLYFFTIMSV